MPFTELVTPSLLSLDIYCIFKSNFVRYKPFDMHKEMAVHENFGCSFFSSFSGGSVKMLCFLPKFELVFRLHVEEPNGFLLAIDFPSLNSSQSRPIILFTYRSRSRQKVLLNYKVILNLALL